MYWKLTGDGIPARTPLTTKPQQIDDLYPAPAYIPSQKQFAQEDSIWKIGPVMIIGLALFTKELQEFKACENLSTISGENAQIYINQNGAFIWYFPSISTEIQVVVTQPPIRTITFTLKQSNKGDNPEVDWAILCQDLDRAKCMAYTFWYDFGASAFPSFITKEMRSPKFTK